MRVLILLVVLLASACNHGFDPTRHEANLDMKIVKMSSDSSLTNDKFHRPQLCNAVLFQTVKEPPRYVELNTCNFSDGGFNLSTAWLYNHKVGDIVHFDYVNRNRFFNIQEGYRP